MRLTTNYRRLRDGGADEHLRRAARLVLQHGCERMICPQCEQIDSSYPSPWTEEPVCRRCLQETGDIVRLDLIGEPETARLDEPVPLAEMARYLAQVEDVVALLAYGPVEERAEGGALALWVDEQVRRRVNSLASQVAVAVAIAETPVRGALGALQVVREWEGVEAAVRRVLEDALGGAAQEGGDR